MNQTIKEVTKRVIERSQQSRGAYLDRIDQAGSSEILREGLGCANLAHGFAGCTNAEDKSRIRSLTHSNIGIVSAYNDILSAHQPYVHYPEIIKDEIRSLGGVAQFAGGVPAMCDGVTQGQPGMDLSLMSRDVIAMATGVALTHNLFDGALMLGICDKIVPGLLMGALSFGHLPVVFVPGGPMPSGIPNQEKANVRKLYAEGKVDEKALLDAEAASYHSPGTCTFYGTANSNQLVLEMMGLQLPGSSFLNPYTDIRDALTRAAARQVMRLTRKSGQYMPIGRIVDEKAVVNGIVGLVASGGSTNLTMHHIAVARSAGILINWEDFADLSRVTPLLCRLYPNGESDINQFQQAGGMPVLIQELLSQGLLHNDVNTICGKGLDSYLLLPRMEDGELDWYEEALQTSNPDVLAPAGKPFRETGGLNVLTGNLGASVIKTSSLTQDQLVVEAPALVFEDQDAMSNAFRNGEMNRDCIAVVRFQGPKARGMPELHKLTSPLSVLQDRGYQVALVTDGRMSGASGAVPAAIHLCPEAVDGGLIAKVRSGDRIRLDAIKGELTLLVSQEELDMRENTVGDLASEHQGFGREMFAGMRKQLGPAEEGACSLFG